MLRRWLNFPRFSSIQNDIRRNFLDWKSTNINLNFCFRTSFIVKVFTISADNSLTIISQGMEKVGWRVSKINALCILGWVNFEGQIGSSVNLRNDCEINLHFKCSHGANVNKNKTEVTSVKLVLFKSVMSFETLTKVDRLAEILKTRPGLSSV